MKKTCIKYIFPESLSYLQGCELFIISEVVGRTLTCYFIFFKFYRIVGIKDIPLIYLDYAIVYVMVLEPLISILIINMYHMCEYIENIISLQSNKMLQPKKYICFI